MMLRRSKYFWMGLYLACGLAAAQQNSQAPADSGAVIRTETKVVLVDAVVTDKKGNYVRDLSTKDFKVWEDNKEQTVTSFSFEADPASPNNTQPRYIVLFFDNSTMDMAAQANARTAAAKFIDTNANPNRLMSVVNFGGSLQIAQNFTSDTERLKGAVKGVRFSAVAPNEGRMTSFGRAAADFGVRDVVLALRSLAKNLSTVPGRKTLILFTGGFPVSPELLSEVNATIDACNRANVAIYAIDGRGLATMDVGAPNTSQPRGPRGALTNPSFHMPVLTTGSPEDVREARAANFVTFELAAWRPGALPLFQVRPPGGGGGSPPPPGGGGSRPPGGGATPPGGGARPPGTGGTPPPPGRGPTSPTSPNTPSNINNRGMMNSPYNPMNNPRNLIARFPESASANQNVMYMLAEGTGGFVIVNTNDLFSGLEKIAKEMNEYYLLGYTPPESEEGSCHTLRVKVDHGASVRARTGYCNGKSRDLLAKTPVEKTLETRAASQQAGTVAASMQVPYFYISPNVARVNVAMEISADDLKFEKEKGKLRAIINILGIAYRPDGSVGARFSDSQKFEFENKKEVDAFKEHPYHYENQFDVASGKYNLKVVFSSVGESFGKVEMPLIVDPYDGQKLTVSTVAFSTDLRKTSEVGAALDAALIEDRTPLVAQGFRMVPLGSNRFKTTDKPAMYFEVYEPLLAAPPDKEKPLAVAIQVRVLDSTGAQKSDTGLFRMPLPENTNNPALPMGLKVPMDALAPGSYQLELSAMDSAGNGVKRTAKFEVQ